MTPREREQLTTLLQQLVQAGPVSRHPDADALIRDAVARQPDAAYLLVQRSLLQDEALARAQQRISDLEAEVASLRQPAANAPRNSFLGGNLWGQHATATPAPAPVIPASPAPAASAGSGWLGQMATTAAGVAAGAFLFQGIEHLFGGGASHGGLNNLSSAAPGDTFINNYFGDSPSRPAAEGDATAWSDGPAPALYDPSDDGGSGGDDWL